MIDIMKIVMSLEDSGLLIKGVNETIQNETKEQKKRISFNVIRNLGGSLLGNLLIGKVQLEWVKGQLEQVKIFNAAPSFN